MVPITAEVVKTFYILYVSRWRHYGDWWHVRRASLLEVCGPSSLQPTPNQGIMT